jgi:hypothetical protein
VLEVEADLGLVVGIAIAILMRAEIEAVEGLLMVLRQLEERTRVGHGDTISYVGAILELVCLESSFDDLLAGSNERGAAGKSQKAGLEPHGWTSARG